ncbi:MAG: peptidase M20, partial [Planctomycetes bacterium]|nr:peptidase M20 [Planctomycetota bacterium]
MPNIDQYIEANAARFEEELCEFLRIPSVSADAALRDDMQRAAEWVAEQFRRLKLTPEIIPTSG